MLFQDLQNLIFRISHTSPARMVVYIFEDFLVLYSFTDEEKTYLSNDFNRGKKARRYKMTKQILINYYLDEETKSNKSTL